MFALARLQHYTSLVRHMHATWVAPPCRTKMQDQGIKPSQHTWLPRQGAAPTKCASNAVTRCDFGISASGRAVRQLRAGTGIGLPSCCAACTPAASAQHIAVLCCCLGPESQAGERTTAGVAGWGALVLR